MGSAAPSSAQTGGYLENGEDSDESLVHVRKRRNQMLDESDTDLTNRCWTSSDGESENNEEVVAEDGEEDNIFERPVAKRFNFPVDSKNDQGEIENHEGDWDEGDFESGQSSDNESENYKAIPSKRSYVKRNHESEAAQKLLKKKYDASDARKEAIAKKVRNQKEKRRLARLAKLVKK
jgi:hypothetical protein